MKKLFAMAAPILPGQTENWKKFAATLQGEKNHEWTASREKLGVHERAFLQQTPMGDIMIVTLEGEDPASAFEKFGSANDDFSQWFKEQVKALHGFDMAEPQPGPMPELVLDTQAKATARH
jgi:hypothetical protein